MFNDVTVNYFMHIQVSECKNDLGALVSELYNVFWNLLHVIYASLSAVHKYSGKMAG